MIALSLVVLGITVAVGQTLFAARLAELSRGEDASFFYRFTGPMLVAFDIFRHFPIAAPSVAGDRHHPIGYRLRDGVEDRAEGPLSH